MAIGRAQAGAGDDRWVQWVLFGNVVGEELMADDGAAQTIVLGDMNASAILSRLMSVAGSGQASIAPEKETQGSTTTSTTL